MSAAETFKAARSAGLSLRVVGRKLIIRGDGDPPLQLVECIRANKGEIIKLIEDGPTKDANEAREERRKWIIEPTELHLPEMMPSFAPCERQEIVDQIMRQDEPAIGWCMRRANAYFEKFPHSNFEDQDAAAASDFLRSQDELSANSNGIVHALSRKDTERK
jgi:hypothetical protein